MHAVERGKEIDAYELYAFGGAAPMHVGTLADRLGIRTVVVPPGAGVRSCFGFLASPLAFEVARSRTVRLEAADLDDVAALLDALEAEARAPLALAGVAAADVDGAALRRDAVSRPGLRARGAAAGRPPRRRPGSPRSSTALRGASTGPTTATCRRGCRWRRSRGACARQSPAPADAAAAPARGRARRRRRASGRSGSRPSGAFRSVPVWDRYALPPGWRTAGPGGHRGGRVHHRRHARRSTSPSTRS